MGKDLSTIETDLVNINQAIRAQEALRGTLPEEQLEVILSALRQKQTELTTQLAQATVSGSGAVAQGPTSKAVGERGVLVEGGVGGSIITGDGSAVGGIYAHRIEAENVVQGMQQIGGDLTNAADAVALAQALSNGSISADSIAARNVVSGFQYIADPAATTPTELRQELVRLRRELAAAVSTGEVEETADVTDAQEALAKAEAELAQAEPKGKRVVRHLKTAAEILTEGASVAGAARKATAALIKLAPAVAALYQIATTLFGG